MPSARVLNEINKIRESELQMYPSSFVISTSHLLKSTCCSYKARIALRVWANFCGRVCFDFSSERISLSGVSNRF